MPFFAQQITCTDVHRAGGIGEQPAVRRGAPRSGGSGGGAAARGGGGAGPRRAASAGVQRASVGRASYCIAVKLARIIRGLFINGLLI